MSDSGDTRKSLAARLGDLWAKYLLWQSSHMSQSLVLIIVAFVMGILTGLSAATLKALLKLLARWLTGNPETMVLTRPDIRFLIWPLVGVLITSIYQRYVARENVARGTRIIRRDIDNGIFHLDPYTIFTPIMGCSFTIGFGASGGSEGPAALSGAAIGSNVGRLFGLTDAWLKLLVGIGAGAGIAAIFKAPMGGVLFTLEVLQMPMSTISVIALIIACLFSSSTAYLLSNFSFDIMFDMVVPFQPATLGWFALLGLFCGLYCIYYNFTKSRSTELFTAIKNPWVAALATGALLSGGAFLFPTLYGEGFNIITNLVNDKPVSFTAAGVFAAREGFAWMMVAMGGVLLLKGILVAASYSGGGVAGDFVPTFFAGAVAGYMFALICNRYLGADIPVWVFALAGMGAVMAGTIHAPLMSIFILCETTNTFCYIFPYLIVITVSYATVKIVTPNSWYGETGHDDLLFLLNQKI